VGGKHLKLKSKLMASNSTGADASKGRTSEEATAGGQAENRRRDSRARHGGVSSADKATHQRASNSVEVLSGKRPAHVERGPAHCV
jgi:hypothetical protein